MRLLDIARASGMSILELAAHVCTAQNLETLARVKQLHATQREVMLGRLKRDALMRLGELTAEVGAMNANEVRACEVMRKACVDILRADDRGMNTERRPSGTGGQGEIPMMEVIITTAHQTTGALLLALSILLAAWVRRLLASPGQDSAPPGSSAI